MILPGFETEDTITRVSHRITYSCYKLSPDDIIYTTHTDLFDVNRFYAGDTLKIDGVFKSDSLDLIRDPTYIYPIESGYGTDTITITYQNFNHDCNPFPQDEIIYIGVKITTNGLEKLGWVKLSIANRIEVTLHETGIEN